ncbi:L-Proline/Glycine betaine transporter ProP [Citrobacter freundii]|uniref:L-Proline/Glycine betaine transporter ProP n=1 Tax=Citrobacter freundii TaxID=546 RepID=A0A7G2ILK9_CITFR|nr:L-Proline/Glycine betaine transporter ProP [Citrobacter freundii]
MRTSMLKRKKIKPITLRDVTIIDDGKIAKSHYRSVVR